MQARSLRRNQSRRRGQRPHTTDRSASWVRPGLARIRRVRERKTSIARQIRQSRMLGVEDSASKDEEVQDGKSDRGRVEHGYHGYIQRAGECSGGDCGDRVLNASHNEVATDLRAELKCKIAVMYPYKEALQGEVQQYRTYPAQHERQLKGKAKGLIEDGRGEEVPERDGRSRNGISNPLPKEP